MIDINFLIRLKRSLFLFVAIVMGVVVKAEEGVILKLKNGTEVGFVFALKPRIVTASELSIITTDGTSINYDYSQIRNVSFGDVNLTDINEISTCNKVAFRLYNGQLNVEGLRIGESVTVYNIRGETIITVKQSVQGVALDVPLMEKGVLIVRTSSGISYKLMNK